MNYWTFLGQDFRTYYEIEPGAIDNGICLHCRLSVGLIYLGVRNAGEVAESYCGGVDPTPIMVLMWSESFK
jgi:hypothetical protein